MGEEGWREGSPNLFRVLGPPQGACSLRLRLPCCGENQMPCVRYEHAARRENRRATAAIFQDAKSNAALRGQEEGSPTVCQECALWRGIYDHVVRRLRFNSGGLRFGGRSVTKMFPEHPKRACAKSAADDPWVHRGPHKAILPGTFASAFWSSLGGRCPPSGQVYAEREDGSSP